MKFYKSLFILLMVFFQSACNRDLLEKYPVSTLNPEIFWKSAEDAILAGNSLYAYLPGMTYINSEMATDLGTHSNSAFWNLFTEGGTFPSNPEYLNNWTTRYTGIRAVNYYLENIDKVVDVNKETLQRLKGEARFIRAINYMELMMLYGDVPFTTKTLTVSEGSSIARTNVETIWDFINQELQEISADLPLSYTSEIGRITRGAAMALRTRCMLYAGRWAEAKAAAEQVMNLGIYDIHDEFGALFQYKGEYSTKEIILSNNYSQNLRGHNFPFLHAPRELTRQLTSPGISVSGTLVDAFEKAAGSNIFEPDNREMSPDPYRNRDPRLRATVWLPVFDQQSFADTLWGHSKPFDTRPGSGTLDELLSNNNNNKTGFVLKKYINPEDIPNPSNSGINYVILRYADVLLMYAEAKNELGEFDEAARQAIDKIRRRKSVNIPSLADIYSAGVLASKERVRDIIRHERMVELAFEGLRFFDLRRWKTAHQLVLGPVPGIRYRDIRTGAVMHHIWQGANRIFDVERDYLWPIPMTELELNPNLSQNPGW